MPHQLNTNKSYPNKQHNEINNNFFSPESVCFENTITTPKSTLIWNTLLR